MPAGSGRNRSETAGELEDDYDTPGAGASLGIPIQVEGMVEEHANHQKVVWVKIGVGSSLGQADLVRSSLRRDAVVCPLPCGALEVHQDLALCSDRIVPRGGKRWRVNACWHHVGHILVRL